MIKKYRFLVVGIIVAVIAGTIGWHHISSGSGEDNPIPVYEASDLKVVNEEYLIDQGVDEIGRDMLYENILWVLRDARMQMRVDYTQVTFYDFELQEDELSYFYCLVDDDKETILECQIEMFDEYGVFDNIEINVLSNRDELYKESTKTGIKYIELYDGVSYQRELLNEVENDAPDGIDPES